LRFEVVRTGRMEIVGGRLLGQIVAVWAGVVASALGTVLVDALTMARPEAPRLAWTLGTDLPALLLWALPWVGLGVASSSVTRAPAIARTLAPALAFLGWVLWGLSQADGGPRAPLLRSAAEAVLPQGQLSALLRGGWDLAAAAVVLSAMAVVWAYLSWPHFRRRDL
jgi:hypothetical protein